MTDRRASDPRLTILLPTRNRKEQFRAVLSSLLEDKRSYPNLEIIVIDGNSSDGTADVIREYSDRIVFCTQKGKGLYAALNAGLRLATGDWVRMVSDDDEYVTGALPAIAAGMRDHPECLGVGGVISYEFHRANGTVDKRDDVCSTPGFFSLDDYARSDTPVLFMHEAMFFRRDALVAADGWSERFVICADIDLVFRLFRQGGEFLVLPVKVLGSKRSSQSLSRRRPLRAKAEVFVLLARARQWRLIVRSFIRMVKKLSTLEYGGSA